MTDAPEIARMLVISTSHVRKETAARIEAQEVEFGIYVTDYGWFLPLLTGPITDPHLYPPEIVQIICFAKQHDCTWIRFDCDVEPIKELPHWSW